MRRIPIPPPVATPLLHNVFEDHYFDCLKAHEPHVQRLYESVEFLESFLRRLRLSARGVNYPVSLLPDWLRYPARALPLGYGMEALTRAALGHTSLLQLREQLVPLGILAVLLPALGVLTFAYIERIVRGRGELDLY